MKKHIVANSSYRKSERGSVLAYTVISALFLFFAVGLGADLSHLYLAKTELQNTADAAALAGATALSLPDPDRVTKAVDRALDMTNMNKYNFNNKNYNVDKTNPAHRNLVEFSKNLNGTYKTESTMSTTEVKEARFIHVKTPSVPINIFFASPILGLQRNLSAEATAGLSVPGNVNFCPAPLTVVDCGKLNPCVDKDGNAYHMGGVCNAGGPAPNPDGSACDPDKQFCKNCTYTIRSGPSEGPAPGNYHGLCCPGLACDADWLRIALAGGDNCKDCPPVKPGDEAIPITKPGESQGAIRQGINCRLDLFAGGLTPEDYPPDINVFGKTEGDILTYQQWLDKSPLEPPKHTPDPDPRRELILPITPITSWTAPGRTTVKVSSLGGFFIQTRVPNGATELKAEYLGEFAVSTIGLDPGGPAASNVVTWVLYK